MDHNNPETLTDPDGEPGLTAACEDSESFCPEKEQGRCSSCVVTEDLNTEGSWSQKSISRSLQRAETLLRSTFNPSLKWLFHGRSHDDVEEEGNFVVAHNLVSRSSARLLRLQQALLTVAPQWQTVGGAQMGSPQVCAKGLQAEGGVLLRSSPLLQGNYKALCRLLQQRSLLLFIHEYSRRAHLAAAYISRVRHLLEDQLKKAHLTRHQSPSSWSSFRVGLCSLSQELRVHLNHWSSLFSRVQSDPYLRPSLAQHSRLLVEIRQTLDLLGLQALVLMDRYVFVILSAVAQTELNSVPREVLEDILAGTDLYNQAVGEQRVQHRTTQLRTAVLQQAHHSTPASGLPNRKGHHPAAYSVKELMVILAVHHGGMAAKQLHCWVSEQSRHICQVHTKHKACTCCDSSVSQVGSCGSSTLRPEWTWEQLLHAYLTSSPLSSMNPHLHSSYCHSCHKTPPVNIPDLHLDSTVSEQHHPVSAQHRKAVDKGQTSQCQTHISLVSAQANLERQSSLENGKLLKTISPPSATPVRLSALPLSGLCRQDHSSVELLFQLLVSSSDLLAPLASHTPTPEAPHEQLCPNTLTDVLPPDGQTDPTTLTAPVPHAADSGELDRTSTDLNKDQSVTGAQQEWTKLEITVGPEATVSSSFQKDPEREGMGRAEVAAAGPDCLRWPHSVQWLDLGQSLVFADLFGQYRSLLWAVCSKALWLQLHVPQAGNTAGSLNLQDNHRRFQILHSISQASQTELVPKECRSMMEDFSLYLLAITAHAQWDSVVCRSLGSALTDKCLTEINHSSHSVGTSSEQDAAVMMSVTMKHFLQLSPPLLSSLCCSQSKSWASGSFSFFPSRLTLQRHTVNLAVATVQLSTVWVICKAYQFLSSWSLNKFLLITQVDLKVLRESLEMMVHQTKLLTPNLDSDHQVSLHNHNQFLQKQQLETLHSAVSQLQTLSSLMLKAFSSDCKRMSGEIFEQNMPSAVHWRPGLRTGFPNSPSEYASLAAQTVIGQVLEGVAPLSDDARGQALSITMTAFMEAWMEHILKQKIKFSVHGALQLKQDFDSIREMIQSEKYGLSAELHQRLLSLRVFQQVDSAVVCLLQQPQAKPYLQSRTWEPFTRCCPANSSRDSIDAVVGSSITNLRCVEGEDLTRSEPSFVTSDLPPMDPPSPGEPYLVPSVALGAAQQEWLDLRIHSSTRRWRLPGLQCLSKSEP